MMTPTNLASSDGARYVKVGRGIHKHKKSDLPEAFHERRMREFGEEYGAPPCPRKNEFGIGGDANFRCLEGIT